MWGEKFYILHFTFYVLRFTFKEVWGRVMGVTSDLIGFGFRSFGVYEALKH
jgi:hypothetical protein